MYPQAAFKSKRQRLQDALAIWAAAERGQFAVLLPVAAAGGIVAYFALRTEPPLWPVVMVACLASASGALCRVWPVARAALLCVAFAAFGFGSAGIATWRQPPWDDVPHTAVIVTGQIVQLELLPAGRRVTLAAVALDDGSVLGRRVRLRLRDSDTAPLYAGATIQVRALLRAPSPPSYPGGWDMQREAYFDGMGAYGFAIGRTRLVAVSPAGHWRALRETIAGTIMQTLPGDRGAIAATLLTGLGAAIPQSERTAFAASGLAHILAVAGLHIGIVMGLVFAVVRYSLAAVEYSALHWSSRRIAALAALCAGGFYLALTGAHVPIWRSFAMAGLVTLAILTGRRAISLRALALAALGLMAFAPNEVMGVSFQMSFAAVLALIAGWTALRPLISNVAIGRWWRAPVLYAGGLAVTSALAGTASLPFAIYHFGNASLWYVPANMLAVPLAALWIMPWGICALLLMPFGCAALALAPMGWGISGLIALANMVAAWPGALTPVPQMPAQALLLVAAGLVWLCLWRTRLRLAGLAAILAGIVAPFGQSLPDLFLAPDSRLVAALIGGVVFTETRPGASVFDKEAPARLWGDTPQSAFPASGAGAGGKLQCDAEACRWPVGQIRIVLARQAETPCRDADVVISAMRLHGCSAALVLDRGAAADGGATTVTGPSVTTDHAMRGTRPWVFAPKPSLPAALTE